MTGETKDLAGRVVIITGAGKGLGRAWALHLAGRGAHIVVNNRGNPQHPEGSSADRVVAEITAAGGTAVANYASVEAAQAADSLVASALEHFGRLDGVIANAGIDRAGSFHKLALDDFEEVLHINFMATAKLLHKAWPVLRESNYGRLVLVSSTAGAYGNHGQSAYAASKGALDGLMKTLSIEAGSRNLRVNSVAPYALTQMTRPAFPAGYEETFDPAATASLLGWLLSPACNVNGKTFIVGGGQVRLLQTLETLSLPLQDNTAAVIKQLLAAPLTRPAPKSATAEFTDFVAALAAAPGKHSEYNAD